MTIRKSEPKTVNAGGDGVTAFGGIQSLAAAHGGWWSQHSEHPFADWQREVAEGKTRMGYWQWVASCVDAFDKQ